MKPEQKLTIYIPEDSSVLQPHTRRFITRLLKNDPAVLEIKKVSTQEWINMGGEVKTK